MSKHRENVTTVIAEIARASGMTFARADRLSRDEAKAVIAWAEGNPQLMQIYMNPADPDHAELASFSTWPFYFAFDHPADDAGEPREWSEVRTVDDDAAAAQPDEELAGDFNELSRDQARARLDAAMKDPKYQQFRDAYGNRAHPDYKLAQREFTRLHEIAYPEPAAEPGANQAAAAPPSGGGPPVGVVPSTPIGQAAALRRIDELYRDAEFMKRCQSPRRDVREAATAEMTAAFAAAYPEPAPLAEGDSAQAAGEG